ncbi:TATA box-binding protein-associated factor RNA polymerase I subunit B isoform X1 [Hydra vulgaris]|uniref:TATA box-binding protein-associated factor RNA polymerase I subunit B isoform X1 n=2 Tax=Hydra vulgaris TaxID=6087 RepID=UPI000192734B|nr:TATA box-binding protein-associated factor RNA polymerase I subunit B isoform X1 [Hydra vulgaris]
MPICDLCDGESFYDLDGKYYCVSCSTQSQEVQVEARQEMGYGKDYCSQLQQRTGKKCGKKNMPHNVGHTWVIYEGYQYLIKAQVEALVKMGFDAQLKNVVGDLWFAYLREMKVAFFDGEPTTMKLQKRNHEGGRNFKKIGVIPPYIIKRKSKSYLIKEEKRRNKQGYFSLTLEGNGSEHLKQQEEPETHCLNPELEKCFTQKHTMIFCYLGLLLLGEPILITDLLRWSNEGTLPYHKASVVLPETMKFVFRDDAKLCRRKTPTANEMSILAKKIIEKLKLNINFSNEELKLLLTSVIVDLEFDYAVLKIVHFLTDSVNFGFSYDVSSWNTKFVLEGYLAAFIFYATKLLYYLDGESEENDVINVQALFRFNLTRVETWKHWMFKNTNKVKKKLHNGIPQNLNDLKYINDVSTYVDYCCKDVFSSFQPRDCVLATHEQMSRVVRRVTSNSETKESLFKIFNASARHFNEEVDLDNIIRLPSSFPQSHSLIGEPLYTMNDTSDSELKLEVKNCLCRNTGASKNLPSISYASLMEPNESCKYLIDVLSKRFLIDESELQIYLKAVGLAIRNSTLNVFAY